MRITIEAEPKEIAALVVAIQERQLKFTDELQYKKIHLHLFNLEKLNRLKNMRRRRLLYFSSEKIFSKISSSVDLMINPI